MSAPKKAAKKTAKKAAKKAPSHPSAHHTARDARRTFEHLGRVQALADRTGTEAQALAQLTQAADEAFRAAQYKDSADLLRAAEHLSFAALHQEATEQIADDLREEIVGECDHLFTAMEHHRGHHSGPPAIQDLMIRMATDARAALHRRSYRAALELARGAEALAHVSEASGRALSGRDHQRLGSR